MKPMKYLSVGSAEILHELLDSPQWSVEQKMDGTRGWALLRGDEPAVMTVGVTRDGQPMLLKHTAATQHLRRIFTQGFFVALTNPKLLLFLAAFFPQFMDPALPAGPQLAILCPTFLVLAALFDGSYAVLAGRARHWMRDRRRMMIGERVVGSFLIAAGAWLALARRG